MDKDARDFAHLDPGRHLPYAVELEAANPEAERLPKAYLPTNDLIYGRDGRLG